METYRGFLIRPTDPVPPIPGWQEFRFNFTHESYDGAPDSRDTRNGYAPTIDDCKREIDERIEDGEWNQ